MRSKVPCWVVAKLRQATILLIAVELGKPPMLPGVVVVSRAGGVEGRAVRSAKAMMLFLARLRYHGVGGRTGDYRLRHR